MVNGCLEVHRIEFRCWEDMTRLHIRIQVGRNQKLNLFPGFLYCTSSSRFAFKLEPKSSIYLNDVIGVFEDHEWKSWASQSETETEYWVFEWALIRFSERGSNHLFLMADSTWWGRDILSTMHIFNESCYSLGIFSRTKRGKNSDFSVWLHKTVNM